MATVAIARYMPQEEGVRVNGKNYAFTVRHGVSLAWVDEADVPAVLSISRMCCGGQRRHKFLAANQAQINVWNM